MKRPLAKTAALHPLVARGLVGGAGGAVLGGTLAGVGGNPNTRAGRILTGAGTGGLIGGAAGMFHPIPGVLGGGLFGGVMGKKTGFIHQRTIDKLLRSKASPDEDKTAALKESLDVLRGHFGPPMTKHAALNGLYQTQKPELDVEALTPEFCKLAAASKLDPWDMAYAAVKNYPRFEKLAAHSDARYRELGQFYLTWADEMVKRANLLRGVMNAPTAVANVLGTGARAVKAGAGAARGRLSSAKSLAEKGVLKSEVPSVGGAVRKSVQESKGLITEGGGSLRRGQKMVSQQGPAAPVYQHPPPAAPATLPAAPATSAASTAAQEGRGLGRKLLAGTVGVGGLVGAGALGSHMLSGPPAQSQYQPVY